MTITADILIDRNNLKKRAKLWQAIAIFAIIAAIFIVNGKFGGSSFGHIAVINVEDVILQDDYRNKKLEDIAESKSVKAVIVNINSPGGSTAASEELYLALRDIAANKPVVAVMQTYAASGGYLTAVGADYIVARNGTLTGSIGVLAQNMEFTDLAKKFGVNIAVNKTSKFKANPNPLEKFDTQGLAVQKELIKDFYDYFVETIANRRKLTLTQVKKLADGRVYTGRQAAKNGLIDAIGGKKEALAWLKTQHDIDLDTKQYKLKNPNPEFEDILGATVSYFFGGDILNTSLNSIPKHNAIDNTKLMAIMQ